MKVASSVIAQFEKDWKEVVYDRGDEVDPSNEQDWYSLTVGFALGKGFSIDVSHELASYIRYHTDLG